MTISFPYSSAPVRQIREIQFGVMSPEEIVSVVLSCSWPSHEAGPAVVEEGTRMQSIYEIYNGYWNYRLTVQKAYSVAKIEHPEVMDENGKQIVGGLMDPRMGSEYTHPTFSVGVY